LRASCRASTLLKMLSRCRTDPWLGGKGYVTILTV